ncbi:MAG: hypothetical protein AAGC88_06530 [Bacteroidota bacterium]
MLEGIGLWAYPSVIAECRPFLQLTVLARGLVLLSQDDYFHIKSPDPMDFDSLYTTRLTSIVNEIEVERLQYEASASKLKKIVMVILVIIGAVLAYILYDITQSGWPAFGTLFSVVIMGFLFIDQLSLKLARSRGFDQLEQKFKQDIIGAIVKEISADLRYYPAGQVPVDELKASHLLDIKSNTRIKTDDIIEGLWKDHQVKIGNVITTAYLPGGSSGQPRKPRPNESRQSFSGLLVRAKVDVALKAFIVPTFSGNMGNALFSMKMKRDTSMSLEEQRAYNLQLMSQGMGRAFTWSKEMSSFKGELDVFDHQANTKKPYKIYVKNEQAKDDLLANQKLSLLLSEAFKDNSAFAEAISTESFQVLDQGLLDDLVKTNLIYAIHSGYVWVLVPASSDKFELSIEKKLSKAMVKSAYDDILMSLAAIEPFLQKQA